jgi:hypothetical protein
VDTVLTRCRGRATDEKRVVAEIYDAGDARQYDGDAERMGAKRCHGKENVHKRVAAENLARPKYIFLPLRPNQA